MAPLVLRLLVRPRPAHHFYRYNIIMWYAALALKQICAEAQEALLTRLGDLVKLWVSQEALCKLKVCSSLPEGWLVMHDTRGGGNPNAPSVGERQSASDRGNHGRGL